MDRIADIAAVTFPDRTEGLAFTGERYVPGINGELRYEHLHRYLFAMDYVAGRSVLDIACGEGYGAAALAQAAAQVLGVDIAADVIAHAAARYTAGNLRFAEGRLSAIPAADASFDVVVCFETLEHVGDHDDAMRELTRVLRPDGVLLISTPNSLADDGAWHDGNPFHQRELSEPEFRALLSAHFEHVSMMEQRFLHGSLIVCKDAVGQGAARLFRPSGPGGFRIEAGHVGDSYFVAAASNAPLALPHMSVVDGHEELTALRAELTYAVETMHALQAAEGVLQAAVHAAQEAVRVAEEAAQVSQEAAQASQAANERSLRELDERMMQNALHRIQIGCLRKKLAAVGPQRTAAMQTVTGSADGAA